jgi:RNA-directed DNA polymerase
MIRPSKRAELGRALAAAFLAGAWTERAMADRGAGALDLRPRWLLQVVREVLAAHHRPPADRPRELARFIAVRLAALPDAQTRPPDPKVRRAYVFTSRMGRTPWPVPEIATAGDLAERLELCAGQLAWLADVRGLEREVADERLRHYAYTWRPRASGVPRLIERPKRRLKELQRAILHDVLVHVAPHDAAHGFVRGRSARTNAEQHTGRYVVVRFDLADFFCSVTAGRVFGLFRLAGYPEHVAHLLTGLCTNVTPAAVTAQAPAELRRRLTTPHLPQGAPTSPALANLCAFTLDRRLHGLAERFGARYTRYADDLTFSGDRLLVEVAPVLRRAVTEIAREEGFSLHAAKSSLVTRAGRQHVCGVVVNEHPNVARPEADRLRALLHEARLRGPAAANRAGRPEFAAHVLGRIVWVAALNPARGARLRRAYELVDWDG